MKKLVSVFMTLVLLTSMFSVFASVTAAKSTAPININIVIDDSTNDSHNVTDKLKNNSFSVIKVDKNGESGECLNSSDDAFVSIYNKQFTYKIPSIDYITDLVILYGDEYKNRSSWTNPNNDIIYTAVGGYINGNYVSKGLNLNYGTSDTPAYLFYTTMDINGNPIKDLIISNNASYNLKGYVKDANGNKAALRNSDGSLYIYYNYASTTGSVFSNNSSVVIVIIGAVIIVGAICALCFIRKHKKSAAV